MKNSKNLFFTVTAVLLIVGGFAVSVHKALAATGGGTASIAVDGGTQGAGVTVAQSSSHTFTTVLTVTGAGITLGASSPTFTIPTGFTAPNTHAVANSGLVLADGMWSVVGAGGGCTVDSSPVSSTTVASGQVITVDITADCASGNTITLTYKGTSSTAMAATALTVSTADAGDTSPVTPLIAGSPTITVTAAPATLNVIKHVINNNGGTAIASAWTLTVTSSNGGSGVGNAAGTESGTSYTLQTGRQYSVSESGGPGGYTASPSTNCTIPSAAAGTAYTCTITNDDIDPAAAPTSTPGPAPANAASSNTSASNSTAPCIAPSITTVPIILESRRITPTSIFISWGPFAGVNNFSLQYGLTNGNWLWNTNVVGFSTTLNALPANQPIWITIAARNNCAIGTYGQAKLVGAPSLPSTGFAPQSNNLLWNILSASILIL